MNSAGSRFMLLGSGALIVVGVGILQGAGVDHPELRAILAATIATVVTIVVSA